MKVKDWMMGDSLLDDFGELKSEQSSSAKLPIEQVSFSTVICNGNVAIKEWRQLHTIIFDRIYPLSEFLCYSTKRVRKSSSFVVSISFGFRSHQVTDTI